MRSPVRGVAVGELEELGVNERRQPGSVHAGRAAGVSAAEIEQRIQFLDRRQPPVAETAELGGVEFGGQGLGLRQGQFVAAVEDAVAVGVRAALPGQAGVVVVNGQAVGAERVAGRVALELGVLAVEGLAGLGRGDFVAVVVAFGLAGADDAVGQGCRLGCGLRSGHGLSPADRVGGSNASAGAMAAAIGSFIGLSVGSLRPALAGSKDVAVSGNPHAERVDNVDGSRDGRLLFSFFLSHLIVQLSATSPFLRRSLSSLGRLMRTY